MREQENEQSKAEGKVSRKLMRRVEKNIQSGDGSCYDVLRSFLGYRAFFFFSNCEKPKRILSAKEKPRGAGMVLK